MKKTLPNGACNQGQRRYILDELGKLRRNRWDFKDDEDELPADLKAVERQVKVLEHRLSVYRKQINTRTKRREKEYHKKVAAVRKEVFFGMATKALSLLESLQKEYE